MRITSHDLPRDGSPNERPGAEWTYRYDRTRFRGWLERSDLPITLASITKPNLLAHIADLQRRPKLNRPGSVLEGCAVRPRQPTPVAFQPSCLKGSGSPFPPATIEGRTVGSATLTAMTKLASDSSFTDDIRELV